jgi:hypothetical protein
MTSIGSVMAGIPSSPGTFLLDNVNSLEAFVTQELLCLIGGRAHGVELPFHDRGANRKRWL